MRAAIEAQFNRRLLNYLRQNTRSAIAVYVAGLRAATRNAATLASMPWEATNSLTLADTLAVRPRSLTTYLRPSVCSQSMQAIANSQTAMNAFRAAILMRSLIYGCFISDPILSGVVGISNNGSGNVVSVNGNRAVEAVSVGSSGGCLSDSSAGRSGGGCSGRDELSGVSHFEKPL